jgi:hypothetical protein
MAKRRVAPIVVGLVVVLALGGWGVYYWLKNRTWTAEINATITWIDPQARRATVEAVIPWSGNLKEVTADVPPDCKITINGEAATMSDLIPGDKVRIKGTYNGRTKEKTPLWVKVTRPEAVTSQPAAPTATGEAAS